MIALTFRGDFYEVELVDAMGGFPKEVGVTNNEYDEVPTASTEDEESGDQVVVTMPVVSVEGINSGSC
jgi:hypothetical protein